MCLHLRARCDFDWSYNNQKALGFDNWIWRSEINKRAHIRFVFGQKLKRESYQCLILSIFFNLLLTQSALCLFLLL